MRIDFDSVPHLTRQLLRAVRLFHDVAPGVSHGALAPERLIVTPEGRLVVAEYVLGSALERVQFTRQRLWRDLHIAMPATARAVRFDQRGDVTQIGAVTLSLVLGRPLTVYEYPGQLDRLLNLALEASVPRDHEPRLPALRVWLSRALQLDLRRSFPSAASALVALDDVLTDQAAADAPPVRLQTRARPLRFFRRLTVRRLRTPNPEPSRSCTPLPSRALDAWACSGRRHATLVALMAGRTVLIRVGLLISAGAFACAEPRMPPVVTGADILLQPDSKMVEARVPRHATLAGILRDHQVSEGLIVAIVDAARDVFDPRRLRAGQPYRMVRTLDGPFRRFEYDIDADRFLRIVRQAGEVTEPEVGIVPFVKERAEIAMRGEIGPDSPSLVAAISDGGESVQLAIAMAEVFAGEIDFNNDLRRGDSFDVLFERFLRDGEYAGYGSVVAAEFNNDGRRIRAIRFTPPGGEPAYYDEQGRSLRKLFLRSPFKFEPRITSRFSYRRPHPVLGGIRPHLGVDYGAPRGTPVVSVANGVVVSAGPSGESGNMVRLRHTNGYETYYLHLSLFAEGIRPGARVAQGQTIGRVGATGLATGSHLDFRMRKHGEFVNPLLEHRKLPPGEPVPPAHLVAFRAVRDRALEHLFGITQPTVTASAYTQ